MSELHEDTFKRARESAWGARSDGATWSMAGSGGCGDGRDMPVGELCPLCILILDDSLSEDRQAGQALFAKYMSAHIEITPQSSTQGWHCALCGASGDGSIPAFHNKPEKRIQE